LSKTSSEAISEIARDNRSGAAELLQRAAEVFSLIDVSSCDAQEARRKIMETCAALIKAQPCMAPVINLAGEVAQAISKPSLTAREVSDSAQESARHFVERAERAVEKVSHLAAGLIKENTTILTHSRSSTVLAALLFAHRAGKHFRVIATESRPLLEGRALAAELAREGVAVALIADAAAASIIGDVDFALVGADRITPDAAVNKTGTRMIALAAKEKNVPVYALADSTKFIDFSDDSTDEHPGYELWEDMPTGVEIINRYFESVPLDHLTRVITEDGALEIEDARRRAGQSLLHSSLIGILNQQTEATI
jgi:translation initiation factor 2B subunit (eIF-2B alpha/beta/delta family)